MYLSGYVIHLNGRTIAFEIWFGMEIINKSTLDLSIAERLTVGKGRQIKPFSKLPTWQSFASYRQTVALTPIL